MKNHNIPVRAHLVREIRKFRQKILSWFSKNQRYFPWRQTTDIFKILIAEMMLRRTKADQVKKVYEQFFEKYPDIESILNADEIEIEKILYPLGLKWRTPAFIHVAKELKEKYNCKVPDKREALEELPGVGEYVAGAVLSIGYRKREWIVDSNVVRLFKRYFGIRTSKEGRRDKHIIEMAKAYVSCRDPRRANLAILDFTAIICTSQKPECNKCPLKMKCKYRSDHYLQH